MKLRKIAIALSWATLPLALMVPSGAVWADIVLENYDGNLAVLPNVVKDVAFTDSATITGTIPAKSLNNAAIGYAVVSGKGPTHGTLSLNASTGAWTYTRSSSYTTDTLSVTTVGGTTSVVGYGRDQFTVAVTSGGTTKRSHVVISFTPARSTNTYYVDPAAPNNNTGCGTIGTPCKSLQKVQELTKPGDTVILRAGVYRTDPAFTGSYLEAPLLIARGGLPNAYITYKAYSGETPKIVIDQTIASGQLSYETVLITASYIKFQGIELAGNVSAVTAAFADDVYNRKVSDKATGNTTVTGQENRFVTNSGLLIKAPNYGGGPETATNNKEVWYVPHFIEVTNCKVHDFPGGGIATTVADRITITGNETYNTSSRTYYGTSGISLLAEQDTDVDTTINDGYHNIIKNNYSYGNKSVTRYLAASDENGGAGRVSDGNGIIIDSFNEAPATASDSSRYQFRGKSLIANNIVNRNGGAGIEVLSAKNTDVLFNSLYKNKMDPANKTREFLISGSQNIRILNNIVYANDATFRASGINSNINRTAQSGEVYTFDYNVYYGDTPGLTGPHDIAGQDPLYNSPSTGNFQLKNTTSPAANSGDNSLISIVPKDIYERMRPYDGVKDIVDRGAFEYQGD